MKNKLAVILEKNKYRMNFKTKLMISFFILIIIPFGLFTWLSYTNIEKSNEKQAQYSANQVLEQTANLLNYRIDNIIYVSDQIFFNNNLNQTLKRDENLYVSPELMEDYNNVRKMISNAFRENDMYKLTLYLNSSIYYSNEESGLSVKVNTGFSSIANILNEKWYKSLQKFNGKVMWLSPTPVIQAGKSTVEVISGVRFIKDNDNYNNNIGVLKVDLLQSEINQIVRKATLTTNCVAFILNSGGDIIASSDKTLVGNYKIDTDYVSNLAHNKEKWNIKKFGSETAVVGAIEIENTDWELVSIIPYKDIVSAGKQTRNEMLLLMAVIGSLAYVLAYFFFDSITRRVHILTNKMKNIQSGNLPSVMEEKGSDEISILIKNYNYMIQQMNRFSEMQYKLGRDVKNAELKALQAQINPHFLYNTLELINWTALRKNVPEISEIVLALAKFYKLSLSKGKNIISIKDEISHIETYVKLQNFRFKNKISMILNVDENLYDYSILKLILQPIVENSILHGILEKEKQTGTITVTGMLKDDSIMFSIKDDGIGMTHEQAAKLLEGDDNDLKFEQGYGIKNVNLRIKLFYGNEYGLSCTSTFGQGTILEIEIPAVKMSENSV